MNKKAQASLQASDAFTVTPSDTGDITNDAGNVNGYTFVYLHNYGTSGSLLVTPANEDPSNSALRVTVYIPQGGTLPLQVRKVWAASLGAGVTLTAFAGTGGSF